MTRVNITEKQLNRIVLNSAKQFINEAYGTDSREQEMNSMRYIYYGEMKDIDNGIMDLRRTISNFIENNSDRQYARYANALLKYADKMGDIMQRIQNIETQKQGMQPERDSYGENHWTDRQRQRTIDVRNRKITKRHRDRNRGR